MRTDVWGEGFRRHDLYWMPQRLLEQIRQGHEAIEGFLGGDELDEQVHVAVGARLVPQHGAEERESANPEAPDLGLDGQQATDRLVTGEGLRAHAPKIH